MEYSYYTEANKSAAVARRSFSEAADLLTFPRNFVKFRVFKRVNGSLNNFSH